ncbi:MAG: D-2-hydroxyacid dehydrogenase [Casimicrobiaceae bacterium]
MQSIVFLDRGSLDATLRPPGFAHAWRDHDHSGAGQVVERLAGATIAITNKVPLRAAALAALPDLRMVAVAATGTDIVDVAACAQRGIVVSNIRGYATSTLPEHVFAMILALRRNLFAYRDDVAHGEWQRASQFSLLAHPIRDLCGSTLGVVGLGALGRTVARLGLAFGMRVQGYDPQAPAIEGVVPATIAGIIAEADVVTLHVPLTAQTRGMIGAAELARMKPTALLINTARGGLVDEAALAAAISGGSIGGAAIDVLAVEPPTPDNPLLALRAPNFMLTPHISWASVEAMQALADQLIDNIDAFVAGKPRNVVG